MKQCFKCLQEKPIDCFYPHKRMRDGHLGKCIACTKAERAEYAKENRDSIREYKARYRSDNRERISRDKAEDYRNNRDEIIRKSRAWRRDNLQRVRELRARYRARKRSATVGKVEYAAVLSLHGMICHICGGEIESGDLHFDHVIPLSRGGPHSQENIKPSHSRCNLRKSNKLDYSGDF